MIVTLIIICEVAFWVLLVRGLALRYLAEMPRTGAGVLLCEPLLEILLLVVTAIDLKNGAEPDWKHGLAAVYIGFTVGLGPQPIKWVERAVRPPLRGRPAAGPAAEVRHGARGPRVKTAARWIAAAVIAIVLLQAAIWYVGADGDIGSLRMWQQKMIFLIGINLVIAGSYTLFPKKAPPAERPPVREEP